MTVTLLGAAEIRSLAARLDVTPTKKLGQNFVVDATPSAASCRWRASAAPIASSRSGLGSAR